MTQLNATIPDGRPAPAPQPLGAAFVAHALKRVQTPPASPELVAAREAVALHSEAEGDFGHAAFARRGCFDDDAEVQIALTAIRLAKECGK